MNIDIWIKEHSSDITLFGEKNVEVVLASDVKLLMEGLLEEYKHLEKLPDEHTQIVREGGCEGFSLEEGMFAYLPDYRTSQELLDKLKGTRNYKVEDYLLDCYESDGSCSEWNLIMFTGGHIEVADGHPENQIEITYEDFLNCL